MRGGHTLIDSGLIDSGQLQHALFLQQSPTQPVSSPVLHWKSLCDLLLHHHLPTPPGKLGLALLAMVRPECG